MAMENISRTIFAGLVQTNSFLGLAQQYPEKTTLNEKFDIQANQIPNQTERPLMRYYTIGLGGHQNSAGADGIAISRPRQHKAIDGANFKHLPFALREISADLSTAERQKYGLRKIETIQGKSYIAYYAKRIPMEGVQAKMQTHTYEEGSLVRVDDFIPDDSILNPVPVDISNTGINVIDGQYAVVSAPIVLSLTNAEIDEILNAAKIIYGSDDYAIISEIGLVTGVNRSVTVTNPGIGSFQFNEVIGAMISHHLNVLYPLKFVNNKLDIDIDVGAQEPMFKIDHVNVDP